MANRLSEDYKVLVLEAGGESNPLHSIPVLSLFLLNYPHVDWQYFTTPQKGACLAMNNRVRLISQRPIHKTFHFF